MESEPSYIVVVDKKNTVRLARQTAKGFLTQSRQEALFVDPSAANQDIFCKVSRGFDGPRSAHVHQEPWLRQLAALCMSLLLLLWYSIYKMLILLDAK